MLHKTRSNPSKIALRLNKPCPNPKRVETTAFDLDDNLKFSIYAEQVPRRPKINKFVYEIARLESKNDRSKRNVIASGLLKPSQSLLNATYNRIKAEKLDCSSFLETSVQITNANNTPVGKSFTKMQQMTQNLVTSKKPHAKSLNRYQPSPYGLPCIVPQTNTRQSFLGKSPSYTNTLLKKNPLRPSRSEMKQKMMEIFEQYQLSPRQKSKVLITETDLITTDELFKKMNLMLSPSIGKLSSFKVVKEKPPNKVKKAVSRGPELNRSSTVVLLDVKQAEKNKNIVNEDVKLNDVSKGAMHLTSNDDKKETPRKKVEKDKLSTTKSQVLKELVADLFKRRKQETSNSPNRNSLFSSMVETGRNSSPQRTQVLAGGSPRNNLIQYFKYCASKKIVPFPLMAHISNSVLALENIKLNDETATSIGKFIPCVPDVRKVRLYHNGLSDHALSKLLKGIRESTKIDSLECAGNFIGEAALLELANILAKNKKDGIFCELLLNRVKISTTALNTILEVMENNCSLQKLGLVALELNEISVDVFTRVLRRAKQLFALNLSCMEIMHVHLAVILRHLAKNRTLEYLNLSSLLIGSQGDLMVSEGKEGLINSVASLIINNRRLIHLDLSCCHLTEVQFKKLSKTIAKSPSLMSVHLTDNSISEEFKEKCLAELKGIAFGSSELKSLHLHHIKNSPYKSRHSQNFILWRPVDIIKGLYCEDRWISSQSCFICEKWKPIILLYSKELALKKFSSTNEVPPLQLQEVPQDVPCVAFEVYDWKPIPMIEFTRFIENLDPEGVHKMPLKMMFRYIPKYSRLSPQFLAVSSEDLASLPPTDPFFILPILLPPIHHDCYFIYGSQTHYISTTVSSREEEVRAKSYSRVCKAKYRVYIKERSVFRNFREDTPNVYDKILAYDFSRSKIPRIVKNTLDRECVYSVLKKNLVRLKDEFLSLVAKSMYPYISWIDFTDYCQKKNLIDKTCTLSLVDQLFISVSVGHKSGGEASERALCRCEFFEILLRIASAKYKDTGVVTSFHEAFELLLDELLPDEAEDPILREFRKKQLWTLPVDDLYKGNLKGLKKVYEKYSIGAKKMLGLNEAIRLIKHDCKLNISDVELTKAYAYSKMTIIQELEYAAQYKLLTFEEFLEFLGRVANFMFGGEQLEHKIDALLIKLLGTVGIIKYPPYVPEDSSEDED